MPTSSSRCLPNISGKKKGRADLADLKEVVCHHSSHDDLLRGGRRLAGSDSGVGIQLSRKRSRISLQTSSS